jgi:hypothetical protein
MRTRLAIIFDPPVVEQVVHLIDGSMICRTSLNQLPTVNSFPPESFKKRISYNAQTRTLQFTGAMTTPEQSALSAVSTDSDYQTAVGNLFKQPRSFLADTLAGLLDPSDAAQKLLEVPSINADGQADTETITGKFNYLLDHLLPYLRGRLSHNFIKQSIADELKLDDAMASLLLETSKVLSSSDDSSQAAIRDVVALRATGVSANYFATPDLSGDSTQRIDKSVAFGNGQFPPGSRSARWAAKLIVPNSDDYTLSVRTRSAVRLWIGDDSQAVIELAATSSVSEVVSGPIGLKAGQLYDLRLEATQLDESATLELRWSSATTPKDLIPSQNLCPRGVFRTFARVFTSLKKVALIVNGFALAPNELTYLIRHSAQFADLSFTSLPVDRTTDTDAQAPGLFRQWRRLNDYITLRNNLPQGDVGLIDVFRAGSLTEAQQQLVLATGWDESTVTALVGENGLKLTNDSFQSDIAIARLSECGVE